MTADTSMLWLEFREHDSEFGVTRSTLQALAQKLQASEVEVIHLALSRLLLDRLPAYAPDDGPLSEEALTALRATVALPLAKVVSRKTLL